MKNFVLFAAVLSLVFLVACGGGGPANPGTGASGYTNASFSGSYVFTMNGECVGACASPAVIQSVGALVADGAGSIKSGVWDLNIGGGDQDTALTGTYSVNADGTATVTLNETTLGVSDTFVVMLTSTTSGYIVSSDGAWALSGVVEAQSTSAIAAAPTGNYVFRASGLTSGGQATAIAGAMNFTSGAVTADMNNNGTPILLGTGSESSSTFDNTTGRGVLTITSTSGLPGMSFVFYVVDANDLELVSDDATNGMYGRAEVSGGTVATPLTGSFAFLGSGYPVTGTIQVSEGGIFTGNGAGNINSGVVDTVFDGTGETGATLTGTGAVSVAGGVTRDVLTLSTAGTSTISMTNPVLWLTNAGRGFYVTMDGDRAESGTVNVQSGAPFTDSGTFGFAVSGWQLVSGGGEQGLNYATLFKNSGGTVSGYTQAVNLGGSAGVNTNNGTLSFDTTGTIGTLVLNNSQLGFNENLRFYQYSASNAFIMEADTGNIASGQMTAQASQ
jgi:hypothetical protein